MNGGQLYLFLSWITYCILFCPRIICKMIHKYLLIQLEVKERWKMKKSQHVIIISSTVVIHFVPSVPFLVLSTALRYLHLGWFTTIHAAFFVSCHLTFFLSVYLRLVVVYFFFFDVFGDFNAIHACFSKIYNHTLHLALSLFSTHAHATTVSTCEYLWRSDMICGLLHCF